MWKFPNICTALTLAAGLLMGSGAVTKSAASTETTLYPFCSSTGCTDGSNPQNQLLKHGNRLYGTTESGGANGHGVLFQYNLNNGNYKVLYDFCPSLNFQGHCIGGDSPAGRLIIDTNGNLYGVTQLGGPGNAGIVYELVKPSSGSTWTLSTLHLFCANCSDGNDPVSGLSYYGAASGADYDGTSQLYGVSLAGGSFTSQGFGVVFTLRQSGGVWSEEVIRSFCGCSTDGGEPYGLLTVDSSNNVWGSTLEGGSGNGGIAFKLAPTGDPWTDPYSETVLYNFCWTNATKCLDGAEPNGVIMDAAGNLFGTTLEGGNGPATTGNGVLFELTNGSCTEGGTATFWCNTVKHNFCHTSGCADGSFPNGDIAMDASGNIFGTTSAGGSSAVVSGGAGTIWEQSGSTESVLYNFCPSTGCSDGQRPLAGVVLDASGNLYGTASAGGANSSGTLWEWAP